MTLNLIDPRYYFKKLVDLGRFIRRPVLEEPDNTKPALEKITDLIVILILTLGLALIAFFLQRHYISALPNSKISELYLKLGPAYFFLFAVFLIPLVEELTFRLPLRFNAWFLSISIALIGYTWFTKNLFYSRPYEIGHFLHVRIALGLLAGVLVYSILNNKKVNARLASFWSQNFRWTFYFFSLYFALVHINNFERSSYHILTAPLITSPQLIAGLSAGYMRIKYGFIYAFLLHALYNSSYLLSF